MFVVSVYERPHRSCLPCVSLNQQNRRLPHFKLWIRNERLAPTSSDGQYLPFSARLSAQIWPPHLPIDALPAPTPALRSPLFLSSRPCSIYFCACFYTLCTS